jgi:hypothetical protein
MHLSYKKIADLKGHASPATLKHRFANTKGWDRFPLKGLRAGTLALCFAGRQQSVCLGDSWYWCSKETGQSPETGHFERDYF